jgi:manganese transport protein
LAGLAASLREQNVGVDVVVRHGNSPAHEIAAAAHDLSPDLVVMASHGHSGIKDLIFGTTINSVRHRVKAPLLIVSKNISLND